MFGRRVVSQTFVKHLLEAGAYRHKGNPVLQTQGESGTGTSLRSDTLCKRWYVHGQCDECYRALTGEVLASSFGQAHWRLPSDGGKELVADTAGSPPPHPPPASPFLILICS